MKPNRIINEAFWLRAIACIAVVVGHCVNTTLANYENVTTQFEEYSLIFIRFISFFGTPTFVFISELILSYAYTNVVPKDFLRKRIKYLLIPYIFMAFVFAVIVSSTDGEFWRQFIENLFLGGFYGYFILIIFQFYLLHILLHKHLAIWPAKYVLIVSFIINVVYLAYFNFSEPINTQLGDIIWKHGYWIPFIGWVFYFVLGYYCGKNFEVIKERIHSYKYLICLMPIISLSILVFLVRQDILTVVSSKRIDMIIYTVSMIFLIILVSTSINRVPKFIMFISKYSFHIYLLHKIFLYYLKPISFLHPLLYFIFAIVYSIAGALLVSKILSYMRISSFLIGKTLSVPKENANS